MMFQCRPEAFVVAGTMAGHKPDTSQIEAVKKVVNGRVPVFCGTGLNLGNCEELLAVSDGAFVGSALKKDGIFENPIDQSRVESLMQKVRSLR